MSTLRARTTIDGDLIVEKRGRAEKIIRADIHQVKKTTSLFGGQFRVLVTYEPQQQVVIGFGADRERRDEFYNRLLSPVRLDGDGSAHDGGTQEPADGRAQVA